MEEKDDETIIYGIQIEEEELYNNEEKNIDNRNIEQRNVNNIHVNNVNNVNNSSPIINNNENLYDNNIPYNNEKQINNLFNFYPNEIIQNDDIHKYSNKNSNPNETCLNFGDVYLNNQNYIEQNDNKKTYNTSHTVQVNGKQINTKNELITGALFDIFNIGDLNIENKSDMQFLRKKNKRRTKKEIEEENKVKNNEIKTKKKLGRRKKSELKNESESHINNKRHSKNSDDNIIKKIHSFFLESILKWINKSFIDKNHNFQDLADRIKMKNGILRKISPKIITTNLKKKNVLQTMKRQLKDIFYNHISKKYTKINIDENKKLIDKIYIEGNQPFVKFILNLTFLEAFNYFSGQNNGEYCRQFFLSRNYSEEMITQFLNNLDTIRDLLCSIKYKEIDGNNEEIKDYAQRIGILCLNYFNIFNNKFERGENKQKSSKVTI